MIDGAPAVEDSPMPLRTSLVSRCRLDPGVHEYAEAKLRRLERHSPRLQEARMVLEGDPRRIPAFSAEIVAHLGHAHLSARADASTQREAVDRVVDKLDGALLRRKDRVSEHKGHAHAGADPARPRPRGAPSTTPRTA